MHHIMAGLGLPKRALAALIAGASGHKFIVMPVIALAAFLTTGLAVMEVRSGPEGVRAGIARTTAYSYDPVQDKWVKAVSEVQMPSEPGGPVQQGSNTIEIFLKEDDPVKLIVFAEALITKGNEPLFEIAGRTDPTTGTKGDIRICNLIIKQVDAKKLEVHDTKVVRLDSFDVVAQDNELDLEIEPVNVVRCGRGADSALAFGIDRTDIDVGNAENGEPVLPLLDILGKDRDSGLRADRVRILGPEGKNGFIENLIILRSSVFGRIEVRDVKVQNVILDSVTLDDGV